MSKKLDLFPSFTAYSSHQLSLWRAWHCYQDRTKPFLIHFLESYWYGIDSSCLTQLSKIDPLPEANVDHCLAYVPMAANNRLKTANRKQFMEDDSSLVDPLEAAFAAEQTAARENARPYQDHQIYLDFPISMEQVYLKRNLNNRTIFIKMVCCSNSVLVINGYLLTLDDALHSWTRNLNLPWGKHLFIISIDILVDVVRLWRDKRPQ